MEPTAYPIVGYDLFHNPIIKPDIKHIADVWLQDIHACVTCLDPEIKKKGPFAGLICSRNSFVVQSQLKFDFIAEIALNRGAIFWS